MIRKYRFGTPINTEATVREIAISDTQDIQNWIFEDGKKLEIVLEPSDVIYGLGESLHGMNKRGFVYISNCSDQMHHDENIYSIYGAHNFVLIDRKGGEKIGLFVDQPAAVTWDIGFTDKDLMTISMEEADYDLYVLTDADDLALIHAFRELIGESYIAPKWAYGLGQSRWGYRTADDVREVVRGYRDNHLPLDMVYMDIDYMLDYEDFTVDPEKFPNFEEFVKEMQAQHIHLVPIIDAGIKQLPGYSVYDEGMAQGHFVKKADGKEFVTAVWPGRSLLPDFLRPETREWFGQKYKALTDAGIDGFWNDMNEPALFYSVENLEKVAEELADVRNHTDNMAMFELWDLLGKVNGLANNPEDYKSFYHEVDGKTVRHDRVHNIYGYNMTRAASEEFPKIAPGKEILMFSRASYIGAHRYGGIWTGDNSSYYSHIELLLHQLPNLNMCGFLFVGADTGGFAFNTSEDLMMRFVELSMFTPLFRNHCALGCREQELYRWKDLDSFRNLLSIRYALIPYLYETANRCAKDGTLMFTPLSMAYPQDEETRSIEDQLMVGDAFMIAPIYKSNATGRMVYVPEDMTLRRMRSAKDFDEEKLAKGYHYVKAAINEVLVFVKEGAAEPFDVSAVGEYVK